MKIKLFIMTFVSIILFFFIFFLLLIYPYQENRKSKKTSFLFYDSLYDKQWFLQDNATKVTITPATENSSNFVIEDIIIDSSVNLGITDFWHNYKNDTGKELIIAIIDSCVDIQHPDLKTHIWINEKEIPNNKFDDDCNGYIDDYYGWNFNANSAEISHNSESSSHGTHCAGIIAADHNGTGVMGILGNTNVKLMILPIYDENEMHVRDLVSAIQYAEKMGADICNISCVFVDGKNEISDIINNSKMYFVVAAGNYQNKYMNGLDLSEYERYPACCTDNNIITVGSIDMSNKFSAFSNYNSLYVDIAAPGEKIYSTLPQSNYGYRDGTSSATPIVTAILGAYYYFGAETLEEAVNLLYNSAETNTKINTKVHNGRIAKFRLP